ncbi:DUF3048 domain-containing protein [Candidatus Uhrbacteria bacterium]|nr:DUF3048 domain-containing protein [Candidatus Uhrbacteria bacterium]
MPRRTDNKKIMMRAAVVLVGLSAALFAFAFRDFFRGGPVKEQAPTVLFRHPLDGLPTGEEVPVGQVYGVVIENMVEAWPQAGLDGASVVIEAPVEARIPRFLAFFPADRTVERIGPVRSARPYFIDWNAELDGLFAHVGGSPEALETLKRDDTRDLDEFSNEWFFWRDDNRDAPHNVYTSTEKLAEGLARLRERFPFGAPAWDTWKFGEPDAAGAPAGRVRVDFGAEPYVVEWVYDGGRGLFLRHQNGSPHVMENESKIFAANVVVMETDVEVLDAIGRRRIRTRGSGNGRLYQRGREQDIRWEKPAQSERLRFFIPQPDGTELEAVMAPGATWIEILPTSL